MLLGCWLGSALTATLPAATISVFAAASLTDCLRDIGGLYERQTGDKVRFNFAASSQLARQIEAGAPADVFFSADEARMDALQAIGRIVAGTRTNRLSNTLVIIVAAANGAPVRAPEDLARAAVRRIALGDPRAVPIGVYARQYLEERNLWSSVARKVVPTDNVRAALAAVAAGNADASIVYRTDAMISKAVRVVFEVPRDQGPRIAYPVALVEDGPNPAGGRRFLEFLFSSAAGEVFQKYGFISP